MNYMIPDSFGDEGRDRFDSLWEEEPRRELSDDELAEIEEQRHWALEIQSQIALMNQRSPY